MRRYTVEIELYVRETVSETETVNMRGVLSHIEESIKHWGGTLPPDALYHPNNLEVFAKVKGLVERVDNAALQAAFGKREIANKLRGRTFPNRVTSKQKPLAKGEIRE